MFPFPVTLSDPQRRFQGDGDALDKLCAQLTRDLFAIAKFLLSKFFRQLIRKKILYVHITIFSTHS